MSGEEYLQAQFNEYFLKFSDELIGWGIISR
jgi:hypothetical protein